MSIQLGVDGEPRVGMNTCSTGSEGIFAFFICFIICGCQWEQLRSDIYMVDDILLVLSR